MLVDAWLLRNFPGRTLEELDAMDWPRYLRAQEAAAIDSVERRRRRYLDNEPVKLSDDEWRMVEEHDDLMREAQA